MANVDELRTKHHKIAAHVKSFIQSLSVEANQNERSKIYVNPKCDEIKIIPTAYDAHYLVMKIDDRLNATILEHSLPETDNYFKPHGTMETYVATFFNLLQRMEGFYEQMDTMDELTCVVDPMQPTTKHDYRIIRLEAAVYLKYQVNPLDALSVITTFFGPTKLVEKYRTMYSDKVHDWNSDENIHWNFLKIFGFMSFPQEYEFTKQRGLEHCNICYMTRMKNQIPIITCDNEKCALIFHPLCLKEWFSSVRDTKTFLNMTSGRCPSCKEKLSTAFDSLLECWEIDR